MKRFLILTGLILMLASQSLFCQTFEAKLKALEAKKGFFTLFPEPQTGKVWLKIDANQFNAEFLYVNFLATGIGSNDIGLDRGQLGNNRVVYFKRNGNKVFLIQPNLRYRAISDNVAERNSVQEAFAQSVLAGFPIEAEINGNIYIEISSFLVQDVHGVATTLRQTRQGNYTLDQSRSSVWFDVLKSFPNNVEMEALITLKGQPDGRYIRSVTPSAEFVSFRVRHSFVKLPDDDFTPIENHPNAGYFGISYQDYATPIESPLVKQFLNKHRLKKKNPGSAPSEAVKPLIYYVDNGAPEPIRSALVEGARWWNQAFEAAGFINAFQVEVLPDSADPLDARYNVIQWVHRATRGWSYGASVIDPRTGEIIKGHVSLGSLRVRQDYLIATALLSPFDDSYQAEGNPMTTLALARLRQLSAHEVGHTIGLAHNFAASVSEQASVMDYPHPYIEVKGNQIILDKAYTEGLGEWDKLAVKFGYADEGSEQKNLEVREKILREIQDRNLQFISDLDSRAPGGAHPQAHLWDNGTSATDELIRLTQIRKMVLEQFSEKAIQKEAPMTTLQEALVPVYYLHRYQIEAAVKNIAGARYRFAVRGDKETTVSPVSKKEQMAALNAILETLKPENLTLRQDLINKLNPRVPGSYDRREIFSGRTSPIFDPMAAAEAHIKTTLDFLFHPARMERITQQNTMDSSLPSFDEIITNPMLQIFKATYSNAYEREINRLTAGLFLEELLETQVNESSSVNLKIKSFAAVTKLKTYLQKVLSGRYNDEEKAFAMLCLQKIDAAKMADKTNLVRSYETMPPGAPIGMED